MTRAGGILMILFFLLACEAAEPPTGPGIHDRGDESGSPDALLEGTLEVTAECLFVTAETGEEWSLILAQSIDTSAGVVDSATGAQIPDVADVWVGGGEAPGGLETSEDVFPAPEACLTGTYWFTTAILASAP